MPVDLIEKSCMRKIYLRLLPFAILSYFLAYIDRINVSFAALTMRGDLGISAGEYGFALGTFYWGYFLFEVPSNVILEKVGARLWIARIMITWGILAGLTALVTGSTSFGIVRFLLGVPVYLPSPTSARLTLSCPRSGNCSGPAECDRTIHPTSEQNVNGANLSRSLDPVSFNTPYYVYPDGPIAVEALRVIGAAMAEAGVVGLGDLTLIRRERVVMVEPRGT